MGNDSLWRRFRSQRQTTAGGMLFTVVVLVVGLAAVISANNLLFLVLAAMLSTLLISNLISRLSLAGLELDCYLPEHVSARRAFPSRVVVRNTKRWMPSFSVRVAGAGDSALSSPLYFPVLPGGSTLEETVEARFERRGPHREDGFLLSTSFPFGFLERRALVSLRRELLVYPCLDPHPGFEELLAAVTGEIAAHVRGRGHDFYRIRPYDAFESVRHVDWKASAHTGEIQVREFAREQEPLVEIFLDLQAPGHLLDWFEHAVDCCAFVTWNLVQRGARVRFGTQEFQVLVPATGDIYTILKYLALVTPRTSKPPAGPNEENSYQIVFTAAPGRIARSGWGQARLLGPDAFPGSPGRPVHSA